MRDITPVLTPEIQRQVGLKGKVTHADPFPVATFRQLMEHVARLSYLNKDHLLFFRGQGRDYRTRRGGSTFYPSIYRGDYLARDEVESRFDLLERAGRRLQEQFAAGKVEGHLDLARRRIIRWAVLQHYEVCATPLLDFTHSLRVACSFALRAADRDDAYLFVFGFPHITNRISVNSEHDLITVRLLSICPPAALRPYFQEGYLAATDDITTEYSPKTEVDFSRRLIAKFRIPNDGTFWGEGLSRMRDEELFPANDSIQELCSLLDLARGPDRGAAALGEFVAAWTALEQLLIATAQRYSDRSPTLRESIEVLAGSRSLDAETVPRLHHLRHLRNEIVHGKARPNDPDLRAATSEIHSLRNSVVAAERMLRRSLDS